MLLHTHDDRLLQSHLREHLHAPETVHVADGSTCGERAALQRLREAGAAIDRFTDAAAGVLSDHAGLHHMLIDLRDIALFDAGETVALARPRG